MYRAAEQGNAGLVKILLQAGASPDTHPYGSNTAFHKAVQKGHYDVCQTLLDAGAAVDVTTYGENTALWHIIGNSKNEKLVRLLLEHGAKPSARVYGGTSVLEKAVKQGRNNMVELMMQYVSKQ